LINSSRNLPKIIIVDDVQRLVNVYERFFSFAGLSVLQTFNSGKELLVFFEDSNNEQESKALANNSIILLDHQMPGLDGVETAIKLKAINPRPKIILVTAELKSVYSLREEIIDAAIEKPFSMDDLMKTVDRVVSPPRSLKGSKVFEDSGEIWNLLRNLLSDDVSKLYICLDAASPLHFFSLSDEYLRRAITGGLKVNVVTDITHQNFQLWKKMIADLGVQVQHVDGLRKNFLISDDKHFVTIVSSDQTAPRKIIYSNVDSVISYEKYLFDSLWRKSRAAKQKISEIEETNRIEKRIEFFKGDDDSMKNRINLLREAVCSVDVCYESDFASQLLSPSLREAYRTAIARGVRIRHITEVASFNSNVLLDLIQMGVQVRQLKGAKGGFAVSEGNLVSTAAYGNLMGSETTSLNYNYPLLVQQAQWIFNALWASSEPAEGIIKELASKNSIEHPTV